ncbi:MAG: hypothetical protein WCT07_01830 [Candidatus Paceibacterota bacterium]|jgi:hypothetical protein
MNKRKYFLALSLASLGSVGAFASVSAASLPANTRMANRDQVHTAIQQAFTTGDYQAFLAASKDSKMGASIITEAQFNTMIQAQKLRASGDFTGAKKLLDEAGIKPPMQNKQNSKNEKFDNRGVHKGEMGRNQEMRQLTEAQKETMKQAQELFRAGKQTEAKTLLNNAGINRPEYKEPAISKVKNFVKGIF